MRTVWQRMPSLLAAGVAGFSKIAEHLSVSGLPLTAGCKMVRRLLAFRSGTELFDSSDGTIHWSQIVQIAYYIGDQTVMCAELLGCLMGIVVGLGLIKNGENYNVQEVCDMLTKTWLSDRV